MNEMNPSLPQTNSARQEKSVFCLMTAKKAVLTKRTPCRNSYRGGVVFVWRSAVAPPASMVVFVQSKRRQEDNVYPN
jgi:hypothetical protein